LKGRRSDVPDLSGSGPVLIVEDHGVLAEALALGLSDYGLECSIAEAFDARSIVGEARRLRPTLVLLDLDLGGWDGLYLIRGLRETGARVLVLSGCKDESRLAAAVALGAAGWVSKTKGFELLLEAVTQTMGDRPLLSLPRREELVAAGRARLAAEHDLQQRVSRLTSREQEVLDALSEGKTTQEVADYLFVSMATVRSHIKAILAKLEVSSQLAAVVQAGRFSAST
jgi:DNA-binding NarL/FixJ family response regulator